MQDILTYVNLVMDQIESMDIVLEEIGIVDWYDELAF